MTEGEGSSRISPSVIPNAERDLNAMAVERQGGKERYECRVLSNERWVWGKEEKRDLSRWSR
jgi:hypothetical protein